MPPVSAPPLACVEVDPGRPARAAVVFLHGLGADGHDFEPVVPYLGLPEGHGVRFVFPHAPEIPVTINDGLVMRAWYDIEELDLMRRHDAAGIAASARRIEALLERERERGVPPERTVLAGFSQGGAMALHVGLRSPHRLAGILGLSCYLLLEDALPGELGPHAREAPLFLAHGTQDGVVPLARGRGAAERLSGLGCRVEWRTYPVEHGVHPQEVLDVGDWLCGVLGAG
jgi:phospholipase/carboxylesterase